MRHFFTFFFISAVFGLTAQQFCYTSEKQEEWFSKHPELKARFDKQQQESSELDQKLFKTGYRRTDFAGKSASAANYTIPVVFHILHTGGVENISDAQVIDAVSILTRDFNSANSDTSDVVAQFKNGIGNSQIDFVLATRDPNGNCTNGIIRHFDSHTNWTGDFSEYIYTWPPTKYLNVYVVRNIDFGAAGYTYLPGSGIPTDMDAIVILDGYVGSIGLGSVFKSRALTHEVGHWLNLPHVWGYNNDPGQVCGDDGVSDTPITKGYTSCNLTNATNCNSSIVENVQNYMDYSYCSRMFTKGQSSRMNISLNGTLNGRNNLSSNSNLIATGVINPASNCVPQLDILAKPNLTVCSGKALSLLSFTSIANPTTYSWSSTNSAAIASAGSPSTSIVFNNTGITTVFCTVSNSFGSETKSLSVLVENGLTQINSNSNESFESVTNSLPSSWKRINPSSPSQQWEITQGIASEGVKAMFIPGESFSANSIAILESPSYDFLNNPGAQLTIKYAYAMESVQNKDIFKVQASADCGGTWTDVWYPLNTFLANGSGGITSELYLSPIADQWKIKNITTDPHFYSFLNANNVRFRYYFQEDVNGTGLGNRLYLDQVVFSTPVGINELSREVSFQVFPNPSNAIIHLGFTLSSSSQISAQVITISGSVVCNFEPNFFETGSHQLSFNELANLQAGIYFVNLNVNGVKLSRKVIIQ